ncbi:heme-copper oxidase subunit III [Frankia sp. CNm7]|uniref:cytochrome-c oxidase n=1 Tax=Frankia nepalensis TaxID=1836974 RepID=A0A937RHZ7_9ACTN|nr:heme-copper oxidase subunit III [Frankia nepalensis]MBL7515118.1 heme-copper oxidase subunit III [Frankia nepalensis]MBL7522597.1 heme-copper oxidase subunit III [Frankia nepalensis]MBL7632601.1 heme-copper oxidase subunit III [Frankia nepalensis]
MTGVATAPVLEKAPPPHPLANRPSMVSVGTVVWLSSELMFFAALFAMFYTIRSVNSGNWPPTTGDPAGSEIGPVHLHVAYALVFTIILVLSSVTCQLGVFAAERGDVFGLRRWYTISLIMGAIFIGGQAWEFFAENEFGLNSHAYGSVYYLTSGFHGLHVIGGLIAFIMVLARSTYGRYTPEKATSAIVVSYYWHFVDVVWIALFATIYLLQ